MAIESIPNQTFRFESIAQDGLNNDNTGWDVLCQAGDTLAVQFKNNPCGSNLLCEALGDELVIDPCQVLAHFTTGDGWSIDTIDSCKAGVHTGAVGTLTYDTSGGQFNSACTAFNYYKIEYEVISVSGGGVTPFFDAYVFGGLAVGTERTTTGVFTDYIQAQANPAVLGFYAIGDVTIGNISVKQIAPCLTITENWTSSDGIYLDHTAGNTDEITSGVVYADDTYYSVNFAIKNRTAGSLSFKISESATQTISSNGEFTLYFDSLSGLFADGTLHITPDVDFDGSIYLIGSYEILRNHEFWLSDDNGTEVSDHYFYNDTTGLVTIYKDWITFSFTMSEILYPDANPNLCYRVSYYDHCDDSTHTSDNKIKYSATSFDKTKMIQAYCSTEAFGFEFLNSSFSLWQRVPFLSISPKYPTDGEEYTSATGRKARLSTKVEKTKTAWIDYVDETAHDCLAVQISCDVVFIDDINCYVPTNDYEPEWIENQRYNLAQSKFDYQKRTPVLYNRNR